MKLLKNACFLGSAASEAQFVKDEKIQIAIVGRSNVGKSSLINALTGNGGLARVSSTPGRTRLINYFCVDDRFYLVDLPGYGFAKAAKSERETWGRLIEDYLKSGTVWHILLLLDIRHPPTEGDKAMFRWIQYYCVPHTILATKADKLAKTRRAQAALAVGRQLGSIGPALAVSSEGWGLNAAVDAIEQIVCDSAAKRA